MTPRNSFKGYVPLVGEHFIVVCRADRIGRRKGPYVLATRQTFATIEEAERYRDTVSPSREAIVVAGRWGHLRGATI